MVHVVPHTPPLIIAYYGDAPRDAENRESFLIVEGDLIGVFVVGSCGGRVIDVRGDLCGLLAPSSSNRFHSFVLIGRSDVRGRRFFLRC